MGLIFRTLTALLPLLLLGSTFTGGTPTGGSVDNPPDFFDGFDGFDGSRWVPVLVGSGSISQSDSHVVVDDVGTSTDGATLYHSTEIDLTKRQQYWVTVRNGHASDLAGTAFRMVDGVPVLGADADDEDMIKIEYHASNHWDIVYHSGSPASQTANYWTGSAWSTSHSASHTPATVGDNYQFMFETRPNGGDPEFRVLMWQKKDTTAIYTAGDDRGFQLHTVTTWIAFTSVQTHSAPFYFALGDSQDDAIDSHMEYEWVGYMQRNYDTLPDAQYAYVNRSPAGAFPVDYDIAAYYTLSALDANGINAFYVPIARDPDVLVRNESDIDTEWVSRPSVIYHDNLYYMVYDCRDVDNRNQICGAHSPAPEGPWTKASNNPFIDVSAISGGGASDDWKFARIFYDGDETNPWKIWLNNEDTGSLYYTEAPIFNTKEWITPVEKIAVGTGGAWDDTFVGAAMWWKPQQTGGELWYSGQDGTIWQAGCAIPSTPTDIYGATYAKCTSNPIVGSGTAITTTSGTSNDETLNVTTSVGFRVGQWITIESVAGVTPHFTRVRAITDGTTIEVYQGFGQIGSGESIYEYHGLSWGPSAFRQEGDVIRMYGTPFKFSDGAESTYVVETTGAVPEDATWAAADKPWSIPIALEGPLGVFLENPTFIGYDLSRAPPPGPVTSTFTDDFNRTSSSNISTNAPSPPDTYSEFITYNNPDSDIAIVSNTILEFQCNSSIGECDFDEWFLYPDEDLGSDDHCVMVEKITNATEWSNGDRGLRLIVRHQTLGTGNQYQWACLDGACTTGGILVVDEQDNFIETLVALTACNPAAFSANDYIGFCVEGTGSGTTTFRMWQLDDLTDSGCSGSVCDPEDAGTWGAADCTENPTISNLVDTGLRVGVGIPSSDAIANGDTFQVDNLSGTDVVP